MKKSLADNILKVCSVLNNNSVKYLIVGGAAVAFHGYYRQSTASSGLPAEKDDLDIWYNPTYENYFKLLNALGELGLDVSEFKKEKSPNPKKSFFKYEFESFTIDFLPDIKHLSKFNDAYSQKNVSLIGNIEIPTISYEDLIAVKRTNARPKDIKDIEELEARAKKRK
jgi:predicted nucleotidyltransferase